MASGRASSGKNAAASDSPQAKNTLEMATSTMLSSTAPGPTAANAAVPSTHPTVENKSRRFLAPRRSAQAPNTGMLNITMALEIPSANVQANVAHSAPPATAPTK